MHGHNNGFSLIRLLLGLALVAIVAAIVLPNLLEQRQPPPSVATTAPPPTKPMPAPVPAPAEKAAAHTSQKEVWPPIDNTAIPTQIDILLGKNYYIILDGSGSMKDVACSGSVSKFASAIAALKDFFATIPADANVGLFVFDGNGMSEKVRLGTGNRDQLQAALDSSRADGGTPLSVAVEAGFGALTEQAGKQLGYGEYHLVVVTDGEASKGFDPTQQVNRVIDTTTIVIHTIGYCIGEGHSLNQPGRTLYTSVDDARSLSRELKAVLAESESFDITQFK